MKVLIVNHDEVKQRLAMSGFMGKILHPNMKLYKI
jgi:hypothetical protein